MIHTTLRVEKCCAGCRRPVSRCSDTSCSKPAVYEGILLRGQWVQVQVPKDEVRARAAA